jgi:hypothetical protein
MLGTLDSLCDTGQCGFGVMSVNSGTDEWSRTVTTADGRRS